MTIILGQASLEFHFKMGPLTYRKLSQRFSKVTSDEDTIRFYDGDKMTLALDIGMAPEEDEVHAIELHSDRKNITFGNKKNCLQTFSKIKQFYHRQGSM